MLADYRLIIQIITQGCSLVLLLYASFFSFRMIRFWQPQSSGEDQVKLERRSYLLSWIIKFVLIFQIAALFLLMNTINVHLPGVIRGAMCATGILSIYPIGYAWLYLHLAVVIISGLFLFINYLDNSEPEYPLTPLKYWLVFPLTLLLALGFTTMVKFFESIEPDVITTCCSLSLEMTLMGVEEISTRDIYFYIGLGGFYLSSFLATILIKYWTRFRLVINILLFLFLASGIFSLKEHFVKYIYALPSHDCLFDMFLSDYYYIGYLLFTLLIIVLIVSLWMNTLYYTRSRLRKSHKKLEMLLSRIICFCIMFYTIVLSLYWLNWKIFIM